MDSLAAHSESLEDQHRALEKLISAEQKKPLPDSILLRDLKKRKLAIKEEIIQIRG